MNVFHYSDYRLYLKDYYENKKSSNPGFSYRLLSAKAKINSSSYFKLIMDGKRNLSKSSLLKAQVAFDLNGAEAEYFENLVFFNQAKSVDEKNHFFDRLVTVRKKSQASVIPKDKFDFFSEWYHPVIRELVVQDYVQEWVKLKDYKSLSFLLVPRVTPEQLKCSIDLMLELGFLKKVKDRLEQTEPTLQSGVGINGIQLINYQIKNLKLATMAFDSFNSSQRMHASTIFGISKETYALFIKKSRVFRQQLQEIAEADKSAKNVYLMNMNFFPVVKEND
jgi:uncharacterized protein (TIGR02147 family)